MNPRQTSICFLNSVKKILFQSNSSNSFFKKLQSMQTGFLSQNVPFSRNVFTLCTLNLGECSDFKELRHACLTNANQLISLLNSKTIADLIESKVSEKSVILPIGKNSNEYLKQIKKGHELFSENNSLDNVSIAFIDANAVTEGGIVVSESVAGIVQKLKSMHIPVYACSSVFDFDREKYSRKSTLTPESVNGIISEIGLYRHADFMHAIGKEYPALFDLL